MPRIPITGPVALWFRKTPEKPAEIELVCPGGDLDLVAAEKGNRRTDAVNANRKVQVPFQIETKSLLRSAPYSYYDMLWAFCAENLE